MDDFVLSEEDEEFLNKNTMDDCIRSMEIKKIFISNIDKKEPVYLTKREWECLSFLCKGKSVKQISRNLNLSTRTVESYLQNCKVKARKKVRRFRRTFLRLSRQPCASDAAGTAGVSGAAVFA